MRIERLALMFFAAGLGACANMLQPSCVDGLDRPVFGFDTTTQDGQREARQVLLQWDLARSGDPRAQTELAKMLEYAFRVRSARGVAACLYQEAASDIGPYTTVYMPAAGKVPAQTMLLPNAEARPGDPEAMFRLGLMLRDGRGGLAPSEKQALRWIELAAARGHAPAIELLGKETGQVKR